MNGPLPIRSSRTGSATRHDFPGAVDLAITGEVLIDGLRGNIFDRITLTQVFIEHKLAEVVEKYNTPPGARRAMARSISST